MEEAGMVEVVAMEEGEAVAEEVEEVVVKEAVEREDEEGEEKGEKGVSLVRRKRGRPETTGIGRKRAEKAERDRTREEEEEKEACRRMDHPRAHPVKKRSAGSKPLRDPDDIRSDVEGKTMEEMAAVLLKHQDAVDEGTSCSSNIKGSIVHRMREATHATRIIAEEMARASAGEACCHSSEDEISRREKERRELATLRAENAALREGLGEMRKEIRDLQRKLGRIKEA